MGRMAWCKNKSIVPVKRVKSSLKIQMISLKKDAKKFHKETRNVGTAFVWRREVAAVGVHRNKERNLETKIHRSFKNITLT